MFNATALAMLLHGAGAMLFTVMAATSALAQDQRPNILVIWGDDVGMWNITAYHRGMMRCETPNIDRIADDGMQA